MLRSLIQKDVRLLRPLLLAVAAAAALFLLGLPAAQFARTWRAWHDAQRWNNDMTSSRWSGGSRQTPLEAARDAVTEGTVWLAVTGLVAIAAAGGMAFAVERRERWAEFAAMLPVSRRRAAGTKLATTVGVLLLLAAAVWCVSVLSDRRSVASAWQNLWWRDEVERAAFARYETAAVVAIGAAVAWLLRRTGRGVRWGGAALACLVALSVWREGATLTFHHAQGWYGGRWRDLPAVVFASHYLPYAVSLFGVAWLLSASTRSATLSTAIAIAVAGGGLFCVFWVSDGAGRVEFRPSDPPAWREAEWARRRAFQTTCEAAFAAGGLACTAAGVVVQTRRTSP